MQVIHTDKGELVLNGGKVNWIRYYPGPPVLGEARLVDGKVEVCFPQEIASDHSQCMCEICCNSRRGVRGPFFWVQRLIN